MKGRAGESAAARIAAAAAILAVIGLSFAPLVAIVSGVGGGVETRGFAGTLRSTLATLAEPRTLRALQFTISQAAVSTIAALLIGLPGAWLAARYDFRGRRLLKSLSAIPFSVPPLLIVLAFVLYYGRGGYLNRALMAVFGLREPPLGFLYSFWGIVLVHGFYNFPIVMQNLSEVWARLPRDREDAARLLGAGRLRAFATGALPSLAPSLAQAAALTFLFCFFSFAVVLVFGSLVGSTLEVEVYRRARIEADPAGASAIALVETAIAL
ncbi:MAG: ABC transporter permease subunit, partial [Treponema sp.]|nr:ABC transporter permease subunit [Treponema sp.]